MTSNAKITAKDFHRFVSQMAESPREIIDLEEWAEREGFSEEATKLIMHAVTLAQEHFGDQASMHAFAMGWDMCKEFGRRPDDPRGT